MVVDFYWRYQKIVDLLSAGIIALCSYLCCISGYTIIAITNDIIEEVAKESFSASVSLFGLVAATVAFVFSAIDSDKFKILRESKSRNQMWSIFSFTLVCLLVSSVWSFVLMVGGASLGAGHIVISANTFLIALVFILIAKFTWVMTRIIAVKSS